MALTTTYNFSELPRRTKAALILLLDGVLVVVSLYAALVFRLETFQPIANTAIELSYFLSTVVVSWLVVAAFRLPRIRLHTFDLHAAKRLGACSFAIALVPIALSFFGSLWAPRSIPILYGIIFFVLATMSRAAALNLLTNLPFVADRRVPVAIYGAGAAGVQLATALQQATHMKPVVFIDDNPQLQNLIVCGLKVKSIHALKRLVDAGTVRSVLVAIPSLSTAKQLALQERLADLNCDIQIVPSLLDLVAGKSTVTDLRPVSPEQLLERAKVDLDTPEITKTYTGRCVMVTGAGGSIGSELCRQLLSCEPSKIVLFERSEHALYEIERLLQPLAKLAGVEIVMRLASVTDRASVDAVIAEEAVEIILHAAAYKHVPMLEDNEVEGVRNNVVGTQTVAEAASAASIERFILVSSDKAVRPTNVMGATKRLAELVVRDAQNRTNITRFSMVRFGNVLGSSGSVVPLFTSQIASGGPLTVTHEEVTRYFMTIPEAARLVLLAGAYAQGSDMFVLNMGEPVKIMELARRMVELSGRSVRDNDNPDGDIEIKVIGLRPGEKLYEELLIDDSSLTETPHEKILRAKMTGLSEFEVAAMIKTVNEGLSTRDRALIRSVLSTYVDGFTTAQDNAVETAKSPRALTPRALDQA